MRRSAATWPDSVWQTSTTLDRSTSRTAIRDATDGEGVDVVLNSLAGEAIGRSLELLRDGGRFLEIGKRDHLTAEAAAALEHDVTYHVIDWGQTATEQPELIRALLLEVVGEAAVGTRRPLPTTVFSFDDAAAAYRYVAQARHIGKVVVVQPDAVRDRPVAPIRSDATYLVTGGLSGLGLLTARHLVAKGARHLALLGRTEPSETAQADLAELAAQGVQVVVQRGDVAVRADVERSLAQVAATMPRLRGVFHAAGVLDDATLGQQSWPRFRKVLAPKVDGALLLHELTAGDALEHFVLYSSVASLLGSPGQANHAAANAFLDALAQRRFAQGRVALSISWGAWSEVGAAADSGADKRAALKGVDPISPVEGLEALDLVMSRPLAHVGVVPVSWPVLLQRYHGTPPTSLSELVPVTAAAAPTVARRAGIVRQLREAPLARQLATLVQLVREECADVLDLTPGQVPERTPLSDLGLDSLMAVELRNLLGTALELSEPLPATLVFDYPTVVAVADFLAAEVLGDQAANGGAIQADGPGGSPR